MASPITHHHALESIRFAYSVLGYEECVKYLRALQPTSPQTADPLLQLLAPRPEDVPKHQTVKTRDPTLQKYQRATLPDEDRCGFVLPKGGRCSFNARGAEYCKRHMLMQIQLAAEEMNQE